MSSFAAELAFAPIKVTHHAALQAEKRFGVTASTVEHDVREALLADRIADYRPEWLFGRELAAGSAVCWTRDRARIYVVGGRTRVTVLTALNKCRPGR